MTDPREAMLGAIHEVCSIRTDAVTRGLGMSVPYCHCSAGHLCVWCQLDNMVTAGRHRVAPPAAITDDDMIRALRQQPPTESIPALHARLAADAGCAALLPIPWPSHLGDTLLVYLADIDLLGMVDGDGISFVIQQIQIADDDGYPIDVPRDCTLPADIQTRIDLAVLGALIEGTREAG